MFALEQSKFFGPDGKNFRERLFDRGYASQSTLSKMMVYRLVDQGDATFDPAGDKVAFRGCRLLCGVCTQIASERVGQTPKLFEVDDFVLRLKGPLDGEGKHIETCSDCGSDIQICGDQSEADYVVTVHHVTEPSVYTHKTTSSGQKTRRPFVQPPQLVVDKIEPLVSADQAPKAGITADKETPAPRQEASWKFWKK